MSHLTFSWAGTPLLIAALIQGFAVAYGILLLHRSRGARAAWLFLLAAMTSMLTWRIVVLTEATPPPYFNPMIAIWGSSCMLAAMFFFGREVVRRQTAERQRDALLESERAARSHAERASRIKDEFLATLSHELRTPLSAILGWCSVANDKLARREEVDRAIEVSERNARVQARLIEDLLDLTRLQAGALHLDLATIRLDVPVRAALQAVRPTADAKSLSIELVAEESAPLVHADAGRLQQVVSNLLVNAVKFTPAGGTIRVSVGAVGGRAQLSVTDSGEGLDASFVPHLFTRFRQADSSTTRRHGGLGLGLSIVDNLVRLHGGDVRAASPGKNAGSTFTVTLPIATQPATTESERPSSEPVALDLRGIRVLVIDDEADVRSAVSRLLEKRGAEVTTLEGGKEVVALLARFRPHVLLIDIGMPDEDGYSLIRRIRQLSEGAGGKIPAISLTAHAREEDRDRALAAGFQNHLPKPVELASLIASIRALSGTLEHQGSIPSA